MRKLKISLFLVATLLLLPKISSAQEESKTMSFWVHEDVVKPSMVAEYETVCKELVDNMKKYNVPEINVIVSNTADSRYLWVSPISSMADIEKPAFKTLAEKMGAEAMGALFDRMDKCYTIEQNYIINLDTELSYMPDGITQTPEGQDYRKFHYLHIEPGDRTMMKEKMMGIKNLFAEKGSKMHYRVYKSGFGTRGEFYMVAIAAKDAIDYAQKEIENQTLLGEEGHAAFTELFANLVKYEEYIGRMRPDMAYSPSDQSN